jgi:hypothetical protein
MEELETENLPGILNFFELPIPVRLRAYLTGWLAGWLAGWVAGRLAALSQS